MKVAALILMRMKQTTFKVIHTHNLVEVFVSIDEEYQSLSGMHAPFFVVLHGFISTPNRRLIDLICEFMDYRLTDGVPFLLYSVKPPEEPILAFFRERGLSYKELRTKRQQKERLF